MMHALFDRIHVVLVEKTAGKDQKLSIVKRDFLLICFKTSCMHPSRSLRVRHLNHKFYRPLLAARKHAISRLEAKRNVFRFEADPEDVPTCKRYKCFYEAGGGVQMCIAMCSPVHAQRDSRNVRTRGLSEHRIRRGKSMQCSRYQYIFWNLKYTSI
jgi:hypothetical protein